MTNKPDKYDVFISHASEDKLSVVRPLASLLVQAGVKVWLDEAELTIGDSLRRKIDEGLSNSSYGVVVLSKSFFSKEWPKKELDALVALEDGRMKKILPIYHEITQGDVKKYSPLLADKLAENTSKGLQAVAQAILGALGKKTKYSDSSGSLNAEASNTRRPRRIDELIVGFLDRVTEQADNEIEIQGLRTGFIDLDRILGGLASGQLHVIASRPSMGATSLAVNIAEHVALSEGLPVLFFSLQSRADEMVNRLIASAGRIDRTHLSAGALSDEEWGRLSEAAEKVYGANIYIDDSPKPSILEIVKKIDETSELFGGTLGAIFIDRLELIAGGQSSQTQDEILSQLRVAARKASCPIVLLTGVKRDVESRTDRRPHPKDAIGSDAIELHANTLIHIFRDEYYNRESRTPGIAELIVSINRGRPVGVIYLAFIRGNGRFENLAYAPDPENELN